MPATPLPVSANVASLLASSNFAGFRSTLGLGSAALVATSAFDAAGAAAAAQSASQPLNSTLTSWAAVVRESGVDTFLTTPSSANLRALITDESGTGVLLFAGGALGAATATTLAIGGATLGTNVLAIAGTIAFFTGSNIAGLRIDGTNFPGLTITDGAADKGFWAHVTGAGGYFTDSAVGDIIFRSEVSGSRSLFGRFSGGASAFQVGTTGTISSSTTTGAATVTGGFGVTGAINSGGTFSVSGISSFGAQVRLKGYTVATLPAGTQGDTAFVTDALTPTFLTSAVGGGATVTTVFYNGTNWIIQ